MAADKMIDLDVIRSEIDRIDDAILGLLAERMAAVEAVRGAKAVDPVRPATAIRPGREAQIIRRLVAGRDPRVSADLVERIWREIIAEATRLQIPLAVHACSGGTATVDRVLIHGRFGTAAPVREHATAAEAVRAVAGRCPDIAVVGVRADGDDWVDVLRDAGPERPQVEACLPFVGAGAAPVALVVGHAPIEATGDDTTVIAVLPAGTPGALHTIEAGGRVLPVIGTSGRWRLAGAAGLVSQDSQLVGALRTDSSVVEVDVVGAFANPIRVFDQA